MSRSASGRHIETPDDGSGRISLSGQNLILLISQPRAGSTLLQKILGAHPAIHTVSEPWLALHPLYSLREEGLAADYNPALARTAVKEFLSRLPEGEEAYWQAVRGMLSDLYSRALSESGKSFFLDKTPRYYFIIPELRHVFADARLVILLRNPLAVLSSILGTWVKCEDPLQLRPFRHDLMTAPRLLLEGIRSCPSAIVVHYEDLVSNPAEEIRSLCLKLGVAFQPGMIEYGAAAGGERWLYGDQDTVYREKRPAGPYATHWRSILNRFPEWEVWARSYLDALGPDLMRDLGYDYEELSAGLCAGPGDWKTITESDSDRQARIRTETAAALESIAAERLAGIKEKEQAITALQAVAAERLAAMEDRDREIAARDERLAILELTAAERLAAMEDRDREIAARDERLAILEAAGAERLAAIQEASRQIQARDTQITKLEMADAEHVAGLRALEHEGAGLRTEVADLRAKFEVARAEKERLLGCLQELEQEGFRDYLARQYRNIARRTSRAEANPNRTPGDPYSHKE